LDQVKKSDLLKYAKNEYFAAMLGAKVARRLHSTVPEKRQDPKAKVTSLALKLITEGQVEYTSAAPQERPPVEPKVEAPAAVAAKVAEPKVAGPKVAKSRAAKPKAEPTEEA
jgi:hypothetical protein